MSSSNSRPWFYLTLAIITEVAGTTSMKLSEGFTQPGPSVFIFIFYGLSLLALTLSLKGLELGFAYAVWSGLGTLLIFFVGVWFFQEPITTLKTISLLAIVAGVMGLKQTWI